MRFLGINGSSRKDGLSNKLLQIASEEFSSLGHDFEVLHLVDYRIEFCRGCVSEDMSLCSPEKCYEIGDDFEKIASKMIASHGIIFSTPVYWYAPSARLWSLIERMTSLENTPRKYLEGKPVGVVAAAGEDGAQSAITSLIVPLIHMGMLVLPFGMTYYSGKEEDPETLRYIKRMVRNMIFAAGKLQGYSWWENKGG